MPHITAALTEAWGATTIVSGGQSHDASTLPAFVAVTPAGELAGLITFEVRGGECEVVSLNSFREGAGVGGSLLAAVAEHAAEGGCERVWLVTTNDNIAAIRFYQRRGMRLVNVHRGAADRARELKPSIPLVGEHGIAIHDELEFELRLGPTQSA